MFTDFQGNSLNISGIIKENRDLKHIKVQTVEYQRHEDATTQSVNQESKLVQTENKLSDKEEDKNINYEKLNQFLLKIEPGVSKILTDNANSHAFDIFKFQIEKAPVLSQKINTLTYTKVPAELSISDLSWNSSGTILAVSYGSTNHDSWCSHNSFIVLWNLYRKNFDTTQPNNVFEMDSCIGVLKFHPVLPYLLAIGKINGDLMLINLNREDGLIVDSIKSETDCHTSKITGLEWITDPSSYGDSKYKLMSSSLDGKILAWSYNEKIQKMKLVDGFIVLSMHLPKTLNLKNIKHDMEVGIVDISFSPLDPSLFIIGTEAGGIFQCSMNTERPANYNLKSDIVFKNPIVMGYTSHTGQISSVHFSPFLHNIFLSSGTEGNLHIYDLTLNKPLMIIRSTIGMTKARWSPFQPLVIGTIDKEAYLSFYNIEDNNTAPISKVIIQDDCISPENLLEFNHASQELLATSTESKEVQIWKLSSELYIGGAKEKEELARIRQKGILQTPSQI